MILIWHFYISAATYQPQLAVFMLSHHYLLFLRIKYSNLLRFHNFQVLLTKVEFLHMFHNKSFPGKEGGICLQDCRKDFYTKQMTGIWVNSCDSVLTWEMSCSNLGKIKYINI